MHLRRKFNYRRRKGPLPFRHVLLISFLIFVTLTVQGMWIVDRAIRPTLLEIANLETQKIATSAVNYALKTTIDEIDTNKIIAIEKDENGKIISLGFDAEIYKQVEVSAVANAQYYLKKMEEGKLHEIGLSKEELDLLDETVATDIIYHIPLGMATGSSLLANLGPKIPVKFRAIGDVDIDLNEKIQHVGINNTWIRVSLDLQVDAEVIIPFATHTEKVVTTIPVGMVFVPGEVPNFFANGSNNLSSGKFVNENR
ncbi:sporulation protein YunB [Anaerobacillus isosaccharinicus]|uniref:Sporulation protein YunB n=1 Tax=Anaerobacillus isosaccharinicus TaxID=1532552 RepID=A0A1S2LAL1_9BACI|nr:sporulation protein YunB [Anaerobacillus isosaccharinicus]MBA5588619.1 sporulation protein YunB [Anaerobacillus isosaccharinicus]QOY37970.1 sporulation protein YunB [Anaerobacillus isosaccharinicus]